MVKNLKRSRVQGVPHMYQVLVLHHLSNTNVFVLSMRATPRCWFLSACEFLVYSGLLIDLNLAIKHHQA